MIKVNDTEKFIINLANKYVSMLSKQEVFSLIYERNKNLNLSINKLSQLLPFSKSGYYHWLKETNGKIKSKEKFKDLDNIVREEFFACKEIYGRKRLTIHIKNKYGWILNEKTVGSSLHRQGLKAKIRRKRWKEYKRY